MFQLQIFNVNIQRSVKDCVLHDTDEENDINEVHKNTADTQKVTQGYSLTMVQKNCIF